MVARYCTSVPRRPRQRNLMKLRMNTLSATRGLIGFPLLGRDYLCLIGAFRRYAIKYQCRGPSFCLYHKFLIPETAVVVLIEQQLVVHA